MDERNDYNSIPEQETLEIELLAIEYLKNIKDTCQEKDLFSAYINGYKQALTSIENTETNILIQDITDTFEKCLKIVRAKNHDYSGKNPEDCFKNFMGCKIINVSVQRGLLVRIMDKISRVSTLLDVKNSVKDESINDTLEDAINYLAILKSTIKNKI